MRQDFAHKKDYQISIDKKELSGAKGKFQCPISSYSLEFKDKCGLYKPVEILSALNNVGVQKELKNNEKSHYKQQYY